MIAYVERSYHVRMLSGSLFAALRAIGRKGLDGGGSKDSHQPYRMTPQGRDILRLYQARAQASRPT